MATETQNEGAGMNAEAQAQQDALARYNELKAQGMIPRMKLMAGLNPQMGFLVGLGEREQTGATQELSSQIVYKDISLAVRELEGALAAARAAELQVAQELAYQKGAADQHAAMATQAEQASTSSESTGEADENPSEASSDAKQETPTLQ